MLRMTQSADFYPLLCQPVLKSKLWGGRRLESLYGIPLPAGQNIGEAWMAADLPEGSSTIANGPWAGKTLSMVTKQWGEGLVGSAWRGRSTGGRFPLLVKFLDAQDNLSVQVHPDEKACRTDFPRDFSKDESWIVVDSEPGGYILFGYKKEFGLSDFDRFIASGRIEDCVLSHSVRPGDFFRVAPGMVHALCKGVAILEIQEPSDSTFRIYDYGRLGDDGKPRELHLEAARKVMRFGDDQPDQPVRVVHETPWGSLEILVDLPAYRIERARLKPSSAMNWEVDRASAQTLVLLSGRTEMKAAGETLALKPGDCVILPAHLGEVRLLSFGEEATLVLAGAGGVAMAPLK
jgi:mannose-6-phosphate isomerase